MTARGNKVLDNDGNGNALPSIIARYRGLGFFSALILGAALNHRQNPTRECLSYEHLLNNLPLFLPIHSVIDVAR